MDFIDMIAAHGAWRRRYREHIEFGHRDVPPETVELVDRCEFGRLLLELPPPVAAEPRYAELCAAHAAFHREAARVLRLMLAGRRAAALDALEPDSEMARLSAVLTSLLFRWHERAAG